MTGANPTTYFRFCFAYFHLSRLPVTKTVILCLILFLAPLLRAQSTPEEKQLFQQLNDSRQKAGQEALQWDERLAEAAREHSKRMVEANQLAHVVNGEAQVGERLAATGVRFNRSGENVGYNTEFDDIHRAWMDSPGHRENILSPAYNVVGIGVSKSDDGLFYATQDFAHALPLRTAEQAEDVAAQSFEGLRKKSGRTPLQRINDSRLRDVACSMAQSGKLDPRQPMKIPDVRESVVYNNSRPEELPESARAIVRQNRYSKYAVGACFTGDQPNNPGGTFYVVMTFYE